MKTKKHRETTSKKIIHKPGNIYVNDGERYMLVTSGYDGKGRVLCTLMCLHYGNRWVEPIKITCPFPNGLNAAQWRLIQGTEVGKFEFEDDHINWVD